MKKFLLLLALTVLAGVSKAQPSFPSELSSNFSIKWTQDKKEAAHPIDLKQINIFVFTSTNEDPSNDQSTIHEFFKAIDLLLDPNSKETPTQPKMLPGQYQEYTPKINIYIIYVGTDYNTYKSQARAALSKPRIYKHSTNIVYLDDIKGSSFKDFQIENVSTCVVAIYDDEGKYYGGWDANANDQLAFDKIYKKKDLDKTKIDGRLMALQGGKKKPLANAVVSLMREGSSKPVKKVLTDKNGDFNLEMLDAGKGYSLTIETGADDLKYIILSNQKGEEIRKIIKSKNGFIYGVIDADVVKLKPIVEEEDPAITTPFKINGKVLTDNKGVKTPLMNTSVSVVNSNTNKVIGKTLTDKYGDFSLSVSKEITNYNLVVDPEEDIDNIIITDQGGFEIVKLPKSGKIFKYKFINTDLNKLSDAPEEDIKLEFTKLSSSNKTDLEISKSIHYGFNETKFSQDAEPTLNKVVAILNENPTMKLEVISHTDTQGDDNSNLTLSKNRSNSVIDYLVKQGISSKRLKAIGKGETEIRNRCSNGVDCSDKEHEYNRRTEFHFKKN